MPLLLKLGEQESVAFGMLEVLIEHGHRKYCGARLEKGVINIKARHPVLSKLESWLDPYSDDHRYDLVPIDELNMEELGFFYRLMCEFRDEGTTINDEPYDHPLSALQIHQLEEAISATNLYIDSRIDDTKNQECIE